MELKYIICCRRRRSLQPMPFTWGWHMRASRTLHDRQRRSIGSTMPVAASAYHIGKASRGRGTEGAGSAALREAASNPDVQTGVPLFPGVPPPMID